MSDNIALGLQLLAIGMVSVFLILGLVVALGRLLIYTVNKLTPESDESSTSSELISKKKLAVLSSVVEIVTKGQGVIQSVKKL
ncbi:MAG: hypothetical protein HKN09_06800 [Saprospiraceae bacterium]|nr:hypothetical protein [Saprospiraceae bacterium]